MNKTPLILDLEVGNNANYRLWFSVIVFGRDEKDLPAVQTVGGFIEPDHFVHLRKALVGMKTVERVELPNRDRGCFSVSLRIGDDLPCRRCGKIVCSCNQGLEGAVPKTCAICGAWWIDDDGSCPRCCSSIIKDGGDKEQEQVHRENPEQAGYCQLCNAYLLSDGSCPNDHRRPRQIGDSNWKRVGSL